MRVYREEENKTTALLDMHIMGGRWLVGARNFDEDL